MTKIVGQYKGVRVYELHEHIWGYTIESNLRVNIRVGRSQVLAHSSPLSHSCFIVCFHFIALVIAFNQYSLLCLF